MCHINLTDNKGFKWYNLDNIWVKGAFYDQNNQYFEGIGTCSYFINIESFDHFIERLKLCNGIYSVIIKTNNETWVAVDRCATFHLFYSITDTGFTLSDDPEYLRTLTGAELNKFQQQVYKSYGYTIGSETLYNNVNSVQSCMAINFRKNDEPVKQFYYHFSVQHYSNFEESEAKILASQFFDNAFERLIKSFNGKTAVVPLSGGYDSRLIAAGLKKHGYEKVICITFGLKENNKEKNLSKKVAEALGYKWIFVEYTEKLFGNFNSTKTFRDFVHYLAHGNGMFYLQEFFAVRYLHENKLIPDNSVFLPGHTGDVLAGSQLVKVYHEALRLNRISNLFVAKKNIYAPFSGRYKNRLKAIIEKEIESYNGHISPTVFEEFDLREKFAKVIFNSARAFDFFGYEKRFLFWDNELLDFFFALPPKYRTMKYLYDKVLEEYYFKPLNIHFNNELQPLEHAVRIQKIKNKIKNCLPNRYKYNLLVKKDWTNYSTATKKLVHEMNKSSFNFTFYYKAFNEFLVAYYLYLTETGKSDPSDY